MLKLRILTALVMVPLVIWALFDWPPLPFFIFLGVFILVGAWEWTALCGLKSLATRLLYLALLSVAGGVLFFRPAGIQVLMGLAVVWWLWIFIELIVYPNVHRGFFASPTGKWISGFVVLLPAWLTLPVLRDQPQEGAWLALFLLLIVWTADTGAYFAGHRWGKTKLAPHISPGKTWEGVAGCAVLVAVLALVTGMYVDQYRGEVLLVWILLAVVTALVSVVGDLFESRVKRAAGVKDSGTLFPGHGGVLDRIDAFTAAAPLFSLVWLWRHALGAT